MTVTVSPSSLGNYFTCPAKFRYSRELRYLGPEPDYFRFGHEVHGLMDGSLQAGEVRPAAVQAARRLLALEHGLGIEPVARELSQSVTVGGMTLNRRVDMAGLRDGTPVLVDYKTASSEWETVPAEFGPLAPKGVGFQAVAYLLHPDDPEGNPYPAGEWPGCIYFLVAPTRGNVQTFPYYLQDEDLDNLEAAVAEVKDAVDRSRFPKVRGYECGRCDFAARCFQAPGWERLYQPTGLTLAED